MSSEVKVLSPSSAHNANESIEVITSPKFDNGFIKENGTEGSFFEEPNPSMEEETNETMDNEQDKENDHDNNIDAADNQSSSPKRLAKEDDEITCIKKDTEISFSLNFCLTLYLFSIIVFNVIFFINIYSYCIYIYAFMFIYMHKLLKK